MPNVLSPWDPVSRPDNMAETVTHIRTRFHLTFGIRYSVLRRFEYAVFECSKHYAITPMQYTSIFYRCENDNFQVKNHNMFLFFFLQAFIKGTY